VAAWPTLKPCELVVAPVTLLVVAILLVGLALALPVAPVPLPRLAILAVLVVELVPSTGAPAIALANLPTRGTWA
jgi:hypothetical protein